MKFGYSLYGFRPDLIFGCESAEKLSVSDCIEDGLSFSCPGARALVNCWSPTVLPENVMGAGFT